MLSVAPDERLDEAGFRHAATSLGSRLGARRIGASVYQAEAGAPIWPYHYHHGVEEWLYVIEGAPVLREPAGERSLTPGDLVCFPSGRHGAHTVKGPGRFVIFATGQHVEPWLSVYPDSDKVSGPEGMLLRSSAVGYWHGEGTAGASEPVAAVRRREGSPPRPVVNVAAVDAARLGPQLGAERLDATVVGLEPGRDPSPTTTSSVGRSGSWSWPERSPCATGTVTTSSSPAISSVFRTARPALTGCSTAAYESFARCACRRRACRPTSTTRTAGSGRSSTPPARLRSPSARPGKPRPVREQRGEVSGQSPPRWRKETRPLVSRTA